MTKVESSKTSSSFTSSSQRASIPVIQASHVAMLLVALKFNLMAKGMWDPSKAIKSTPIPFLYWFTARSKYIFDAPSLMSKISSSGKSFFPFSLSMGFSAQKSYTTLPLMVILAIYFKSNFANRINHLDNLPLRAGFSNRNFNGSILAYIHTWKGGRTMCLSFCTAYTRVKHDFSMGVYLVS